MPTKSKSRHPLAKHLNTRKNIQVERDLEEDSSVSGYLIDMADDLALLHTFNDFDPDGYMIIRNDDVDDVISGPEERHWDRMLAAENLLQGLDPEFNIDLTNWQSAIADVQRLFGKMIIERESLDDDDDDDDQPSAFVGAVAELTDREVVFNVLDGTGQWDDEPETIAYLDITTVQFDTPYLNRFWLYIQGPPPNADG